MEKNIASSCSIFFIWNLKNLVLQTVAVWKSAETNEVTGK